MMITIAIGLLAFPNWPVPNLTSVHEFDSWATSNPTHVVFPYKVL